MSQQLPHGDANEKYKKKLFVDTGMGYTEVGARVIEPYTPPTLQPRVKEIQIINAPSHLHSTGYSAYKATLNLLFMDKKSYNEYLSICGWTHKFYDEKGSIYLGSLESVKPTAVEASKKYKVEITLLLIKKDTYDDKDRFKFQDIQGHWAEVNISEMANLGLVSVITRDGQPVIHFNPDQYITRAEFITFLNRTRRLLERAIRD